MRSSRRSRTSTRSNGCSSDAGKRDIRKAGRQEEDNSKEGAKPHCFRLFFLPSCFPYYLMKTRADDVMEANRQWTIGRLLDWTAQYLLKKGSEYPRLDAEVLLAHAL